MKPRFELKYLNANASNAFIANRFGMTSDDLKKPTGEAPKEASIITPSNTATNIAPEPSKINFKKVLIIGGIGAAIIGASIFLYKKFKK